MTTPGDVRGRLEAAGQVVTDEDQGNVVRLYSANHDATVSVWPNGTCHVQGRDQAEVEAILGDLVGKARGRGPHTRPAASVVSAAAAQQPQKKVFVVYGHDTAARTQLEAMLRRWGLEPIILDQLASGGNTIIEKLEQYQQGIEWAVVLLTPDDLGHPALDPTKSAPRPRQNVVLEMGMLLGKLGRQRVVMLHRESDPPMELPSDVQGYLYIAFKNGVEETREQLAKEMSVADFYQVPVGRM